MMEHALATPISAVQSTRVDSAGAISRHLIILIRPGQSGLRPAAMHRRQIASDCRRRSVQSVIRTVLTTTPLRRCVTTIAPLLGAGCRKAT